MALSAKYKDYLNKPSEAALASPATLNYVTSTTSLTGPASIMKHIHAQQQVVEKKIENFLNVIENSHSLCVETETTLHFKMGGGTYLPGIDDNFLADKNVTLPITHIVTFDSDGKIHQIRLMWDQGTLLKAIDTIGARGRNWPIRMGPEQIKMIKSSSTAAPLPVSAAQDEERQGRRNSRGVDPHSTLRESLFSPREPHARAESPLKNVEVRQSAKPGSREWSELFAAGSTDPALASPERSPSPSKRDRGGSNPLKSGAGKNYHPSRLFDENPEVLKQKGIKTDANKYNHFEFGDSGPDPAVAAATGNPAAKPKNKNLSQWTFEDFMTPEKPKSKNLAHHQPNFAWENQNEADVRQAEKPQVFRQPIHKARPDASYHFEFEDSTPVADRTRPATSNSNRNDLYAGQARGGYDGYAPSADEKMPLTDITKNQTSQHNKTFGPHWEMSDASPDVKDKVSRDENASTLKAAANKPEVQSRANRNMQASWSLYDSSPVQNDRGIKIAGNGMGKKKHGEREWWEFGDQ